MPVKSCNQTQTDGTRKQLHSLFQEKLSGQNDQLALMSCVDHSVTPNLVELCCGYRNNDIEAIGMHLVVIFKVQISS